MNKIKRYLEQGTIYFITSVTKDRLPIFKDKFSAQFLVSCISYHKFVLEFNLFGYVIMPEHFHILIQPSKKYNLSEILRFIKGNFARKYNEFKNQKCEVWQRGFYDIAMRDSKDVFRWLEYMHYNPVKKGLVETPEKYEFSSWWQYFGSKRGTIFVPIDSIL
ncbi:MAG: transposase [Endomicrobiia bacterium]